MPRVRNLSLTGIFYKSLAADGLRPQLPLAACFALSIGPLTPPYQAALCLEGMSLPSMEKLRVCGAVPGITSARLVAGQMDEFPKLKEVQWDCGRTDTRYCGGEAP